MTVVHDESLAKMGGRIVDTSLWHMCVGIGVGVASSDQLHLFPCAFPFHVPYIDSRRLHSGEQMADGSENLRHCGCSYEGMEVGISAGW